MLYTKYTSSIQALLNLLVAVIFPFGYMYVYIDGIGIGFMNKLLMWFSITIIVFQIPLLLSVYGFLGKKSYVIVNGEKHDFSKMFKEKVLLGSCLTSVIFGIALMLINSTVFNSIESVIIMGVLVSFRAFILYNEYDKYNYPELVMVGDDE